MNSIIAQYQNFLRSQTNISLIAERLQSLEKMSELGFPTKKWENWKYTSLKPVTQYFQADFSEARSIQKLQLGHFANEVTIQCHNGYFDISGSQDLLAGLGIEISPLDWAIENKKIEPLEIPESFALLNSALYENGIYIKVKKTCRLEKPLTIRYVADIHTQIINPFVVLELEESAHIKLHEVFDKVEASFVNSQTQLRLSENSSLKYYKFLNLKQDTSYIGSTTGIQKSKSHLEYLNLSTGSVLARENANFYIDDSHAECILKGLSTLLESRMMDHSVLVSHRSEASMSRQYFKSILKNQSHYVFQGKIHIAKAAQKTDSEQLNKNLLLDKNSTVDTKPQLDVYANDVKANHGATVGQLNSEEKFYLLSRGVSPEKVNELLCFGYALDLLEPLTNEFAKNHASSFLNQYLKGFLP